MSNLTNLILENEGLIYKIISKYQNYFELDDLYQEAVKGLIKASNNYKSEYNTKFTSYAYPYILGEVIKYINEYNLLESVKPENGEDWEVYLDGTLDHTFTEWAKKWKKYPTY